MSTSLRTLKGVGEKTEKLFAKIGVTDMESLLSYYPRNYDAYYSKVPEICKGMSSPLKLAPLQTSLRQ